MAFQPIRHYRITAGATASSALSLALPAGFDRSAYKIQARVSAVTNPAVVNFGGSTVAASTTYTGNALPDGNMHIQSGLNPEIFDLPPTSTHVSVIRTGAADGEVHITLGMGLNI